MNVQPLKETRISAVLDRVCSEVSKEQSDWIFKRDDNNPSHLFHAVQCTRHSESSSSKDKTQSCPETPMISIYFGYSTWDGRILFLDDSKVMDITLSVVVRLMLCRVALQLQCARLTWYHEKPPQLPSFMNVCSAESEVLTLNWESTTAKTYLGQQHSADGNHESSPRDTIKKVLNNIRGDTVSLRLAERNEMGEKELLVRGLAEFVNELDAVKIGADQYKIDGFDSDPPIFYCMLIHMTDSNDVDGDGSSKPRGMAVFYEGEKLDGGKFLYLEE